MAKYWWLVSEPFFSSFLLMKAGYYEACRIKSTHPVERSKTLQAKDLLLHVNDKTKRITNKQIDAWNIQLSCISRQQLTIKENSTNQRHSRNENVYITLQTLQYKKLVNYYQLITLNIFTYCRIFKLRLIGFSTEKQATPINKSHECINGTKSMTKSEHA